MCLCTYNGELGGDNLSDIRTIKQQLKPWPSYDDPKRYYVNDWVDRIGCNLIEYMIKHSKMPSLNYLRKVGTVWYDNMGEVHVNGIYDMNLTAFIWKTMTETQFTEQDYDPSRFARLVDWVPLLDKVPYRMDGDLYRFDYKGREYKVDHEFFVFERTFNQAYIGPEGVRFESESIDLQELVLQLIADNEFNYDCSDICSMFQPMDDHIIDNGSCPGRLEPLF